MGNTVNYIMISSESLSERELKLLKRIRELKEIVDNSAPVFSQEIPVGFTPARWHLALQNYDSRLAFLKSQKLLLNSVSSDDTNVDSVDDGVEIEFGPEWELKCAQKELEDLLNA